MWRHNKTDPAPHDESSPETSDDDEQTRPLQSRPSIFNRPRVIPISNKARPSRLSYGMLPDLDEEDDVYKRTGKRPTIILPALQDDDRKFFDLVASGNVAAVKSFLKDHQDYDINCVNFQGLSALHIAVKSHNEAMVKALLEEHLMEVSDCALHAIAEKQPVLMEMILNRLSDIAPDLEYAGCKNSSQFPDDTTPLMLAAQVGDFEIIRKLITRGHRIKRPHPPDCMCKEVCRPAMETQDVLMAAHDKLNVYRALTNPAYICHSSNDPILTAFLLSDELMQCAKIYQEFRIAYMELAKTCKIFAVQLIGTCRNAGEVELILKQKAGSSASGAFMLPRLMLAMDYNQKEFVAHPNTQQVLESAWHGNWHDWQRRSTFRKTLSALMRVFMLPVVVMMCVFCPYTRWSKRWQLPINKMLSSIASYFVFLVLVFIESNQDKRDQKRGPPNSGLEIVLVVFVVGHVWSSIRMCMLQGPTRYLGVLMNWYDVVTQTMFIVTFVFWLLSFLDVATNGDRDVPRKDWDYLDYTLVAESFFTIATIMAFGRILLLCQLNYHLGPLQVSLGKMAKDLAKFIVLFFILIMAFSAGLCTFYQYYEGMVKVDTVSGIHTVQEPSFVSFHATLRTLFWALFCMAPIESANVVIDNSTPSPTTEPDLESPVPETETHPPSRIQPGNEHKFTETVGYFIFALFMVISVIVILNMLIATMSNTYQKVTENVDIEWTFGRTEVYIAYMSQTVLPPPFNLIPTFSSFESAYFWVAQGKTGEQKAECSLAQCCYMVETTEKVDKKQFPELMSQLAQRYFQQQKP